MARLVFTLRSVRIEFQAGAPIEYYEYLHESADYLRTVGVRVFRGKNMRRYADSLYVSFHGQL